MSSESLPIGLLYTGGTIGMEVGPKCLAITSDAAEFEAEYAAALREAYPQTGHGTVYPFRRVFAVGRKNP